MQVGVCQFARNVHGALLLTTVVQIGGETLRELQTEGGDGIRQRLL